MENKQFQFKTNINCSGCISKVQPYLDNEVGINQWHVDTSSKDKLLTVKANSINLEKVIETVVSAGFKIEKI